MKKSPNRRIALFLGEELGFHNQARIGIVQYARPNHPWRFAHLSRRLKDLLKMRPDGWDGGIANFTDARKVAAVRRFGMPVVNMYGGHVSWGLPQVGVDNQAIGQVAAEYFLRKGSPNLAFYGLSGSGYSIGRWIGFRNAAMAQGVRPDRFVYRDITEIEKGIGEAAKLARWVSRLPKPVSVLTCDALRGIWLTEVCYSLGIRIPEDLAIVCVSGDELTCQTAFPPLSNIPLSEEKCGYLAAEMLDNVLKGRKIQPHVLLAPGSVIERMSSDIQHVPDPAVAKALAHIRSQAIHGLRVDDLAPHTGVCRRVLERKFRSLIGKSPHETIRDVQIEEAKRLLNTTDATLESIAHSIGLSSGIHLSHEFKKHTGKTPGQYRKQFRLL
jgi:LacI family transcriptional regulator